MKKLKLFFYGSGISDFSHVRLQIRKRDGKYEEIEVKIDSPYWLEDGDTARVTNENEGKHVNLKITRERQASTQDRSRR